MQRRNLLLAAGGAVALALAPRAAGAQTRPLVFAFQPQRDPASIRAAADRMAAAVAQRLGTPVEVLIPGAYTATVQALVARQADVAWLSSLPFLLARRDGGARLILAEVRTDARGRARTDYDSILVVRADSPLRSFADFRRQASRLRMVFTSPTSTSGYIIPYAHFVAEGMLRPGEPPERAFAQLAYGGSYTQALEQVAQGRGDVAAVSDYTMEGPRADVYLPADTRARLRVLTRIPGVPTHLVAVRGGLDPSLARRIQAALLAVSREQPGLLSEVYGATALAVVDEARHVRATVAAIERTGLPIQGLVR